jgi:epoxyqueuosine reductase QueG
MSSTNLSIHTIKQQLDDFVLKSPKNIVPDLGMMRLYELPLVAIASAEDLYWDELKKPEVIGPGHLSPTEWLSGARSVISCFLPFTERIRKANRSQGWPAMEWVYGRYEGGLFVNDVCRFLEELVRQAGGQALAPSVNERFAVVKKRSNWSERHAAFIAGHGTFSLNRSLITSAGSAGRIGSVITDLELEPTPRAYTEVEEYCTKCGACMKRCPPMAIDENGKDNAVCSKFCDETKVRHAPRYGCGKCQTGTPCEAGRPLSSESAST